MTKENNIIDWIRNKVYTLILPIYLWSIDMKDLDTYMEHVIKWEVARGGITEEKVKQITEELRKTGV